LELCYGVVRNRSALDWIIARKAPDRVQKPTIQWCLRLGLYQIFWLSRVPDHAAVFETVEQVKQLGFGPQAGFVNAVLRGCLREEAQLRLALEELQKSDPARAYSHPQWLFERWQAQFGSEEAIKLLEWNNRPPVTYARINTLKADPGKLLEQWRDEDVQYNFFQRSWTGESVIFQLKEHPPLASLRSFQEGQFYIQDPSTLAAVHDLDPQPGESILDLCAAPGGKTTFIAQRMQNQGRIVAEDTNPERLQLLRENCTRLGTTCVDVVRSPETFLPELSAQFDRVLLDAPCSNTGVIRRRVDLRWRLSPGEIDRMRRVQEELVERALVQLKPGGILAYSTCSLEPEENGEQVKRFLAAHSDCELDGERFLLPVRDGVDGAYVARILRK
jgi:16S rRNA (cytosine967-C5)-methyltransferase